MGCRLIAGKAVDYAADAGHMACSANIATARTAARLCSVGISSCKDAQECLPCLRAVDTTMVRRLLAMARRA
jgi:hypothetical protein